MLLTLALRNIARNMRRLLPMVVMLCLSFLTLLLGNAVLTRSESALEDIYARHIAGNLSVSATSDDTFTIFGSQRLLVAEYLTPQTIVDFDALERAAGDLGEVRATAGLVSSLARVRVSGRSHEQTLFGVDFASYREVFPDLELVAGRFPKPGRRGIVLQVPGGQGGSGTELSETGLGLEEPAWSEEVVGKKAVLAVARETSFTLREVPVTGVFRYPVEDSLLNTVALVDAETARALNGYIYGAREAAEVPEEQQELLEGEMDAMFAGGDSSGAEAGGDAAGTERTREAGDAGPSAGAADPEALLDRLSEAEDAEAARETIAGAWNFLILRTETAADASVVAEKLRREGYTEKAGYDIRGWRETVGGTAQIVSYLQLLFNAGLLFLAFGAAVVLTNALVLSVLERTREIGTLRALGATKPRVALLISLETVIVVTGAAAFGVLLGVWATSVLNDAAVTVENRYITILSGGGPIRGTVTGGLLLWHGAFALALSVISILYPLKRALGIAPVEAMAE